MVRDRLDAQLSWAASANSVSYNVKSDSTKPFAAPTLLLNSPTNAAIHVDAVLAPPDRYFYRINGVGCNGEEGP